MLDLNQAGALEAIRDYWALPSERVLPNAVEYLLDLGAQTAVLEVEYIDADYRDEHASFWYSTFQQYPAVAARLHFFTAAPSEFSHAEPKPFILMDRGYLGYIVLRPVPTAPVGRTMLAWDPNSAMNPKSVVLCLTVDHANVFGSRLAVTGAPFYSQDRRLTRCGHATMMSTAYYYHRFLRGSRVLPGAIAEAAARVLNSQGRAVPSPGVSLTQVIEAANAIRVPPRVYSLNPDQQDDPEAVICRYLNSKFPVVVFTKGHAFLLVGYERVPQPDGTHKIRFLRHDDERGPYQWVEMLLDEHYGRWQNVVVPLPTKVHLPGLEAEEVGRLALEEILENSSEPEDRELFARWKDPARPLSLRSSVVTSNSFKGVVLGRLLPPDVAASYQFVHMSRFVWVVELTDRALRDAGEPPVFAEVVIDATDHPVTAHPLASRTPGGFTARDPSDAKDIFDASRKSPRPAKSVIDAVRAADHPA